MQPATLKSFMRGCSYVVSRLDSNGLDDISRDYKK